MDTFAHLQEMLLDSWEHALMFEQHGGAAFAIFSDAERREVGGLVAQVRRGAAERAAGSSADEVMQWIRPVARMVCDMLGWNGPLDRRVFPVL
jgi:hypothetical protein